MRELTILIFLLMTITARAEVEINFSTDGKFVSANELFEFKIFDVASGQKIISEKTDGIRPLFCNSASSLSVLMGEQTDKLKILDPIGNSTKEIKLPHWGYSLTCSKKDDTAYIGAPGAIYAVSLSSGAVIKTLKVGRNIKELLLSPGENRIYALSDYYGEFAEAYDLQSEKKLFSFAISYPVAFKPKPRLQVSPDEKFIAIDQTVYQVENGIVVYEPKNLQKLDEIKFYFSPNNQLFVVHDNQQQYWSGIYSLSLNDFSEQWRYDEHLNINASALSPDGSVIGLGNLDGIWILDTKTGKLSERINTTVGGANGIAFAPDSQSVVTSGQSLNIFMLKK